jgi:hypothetical protein
MFEFWNIMVTFSLGFTLQSTGISRMNSVTRANLIQVVHDAYNAKAESGANTACTIAPILSLD